MNQIKQEGSNIKSEKIKKVFNVEVSAQEQKDSDSRVSNIFSQQDRHFVRKYHDRKDMLRTYRDIPLALDRLYKETNYVKERHGHDLQISIDTQLTSKKRKRQVTLVKDSFSTDEEQVFLKLHTTFLELQAKYPEKTIYDITDTFMKVSGDINAVKEHLAGNKVVQWTYLEDIILSMPDNSSEYRCLVTSKGREEIDKRKYFLLRVNPNQNDNETLATRSALKRSVSNSQNSSVRKSNLKEKGATPSQQSESSAVKGNQKDAKMQNEENKSSEK